MLGCERRTYNQIFYFSAFAKNISDQATQVIQAIILTTEEQVVAANMMRMAGTDYSDLANKLRDVSLTH